MQLSDYIPEVQAKELLENNSVEFSVALRLDKYYHTSSPFALDTKGYYKTSYIGEVKCPVTKKSFYINPFAYLWINFISATMYAWEPANSFKGSKDNSGCLGALISIFFIIVFKVIIFSFLLLIRLIFVLIGLIINFFAFVYFKITLKKQIQNT